MVLGPIQAWTINGLDQLAQDDPDCASTINHVGFSKLDGEFGKSLIKGYTKYGKLTSKQWTYALKLAFKYRRQIGPPPMEFTFPNF